MDASIFDSALSHTRRSDASEKREEISVSNFGRFRLWTSFEFSPVSVNCIIFRSDPNDETAYVFIDNFCALEKDEEILNIWGGKFALQAFTFVEADSEIFLHCEVC